MRTVQAAQDEIGILCRAFADMALKIQERQHRLEHQFNLKEAELKKTDHTLKQFQLIAERSEKFAALGRLGAAVAHEIRTPLTSLKLFLESVEDEIEISPEYTEDFTVAMGQIARIEAAINRLLEFTKPKDLFFSLLNVDRLVTDVVSIIKPLANKQECTIAMDIQNDLPRINADKKLIEEGPDQSSDQFPGGDAGAWPDHGIGNTGRRGYRHPHRPVHPHRYYRYGPGHCR